MKIAFNPSTVAALTSPPNNKDITFDLKGHNIFARGVEFKGTDTNTWRPVVDSLTSDSTTSSLSAKQGKVLKALIDNKSNSGHTHDDRYLKLTGGTLTGNLTGTSATFSGRFYGNGDDEGIIIKPASNGYAGLILGAHGGERSVFYFIKGNPFWRYNNGTNNLDIKHPKKAGTIALTSDIPTKGSWNYDDRYLRLSGGTMTSDALITFADSGSWGTDKGPQGARGGLKWSGQSDYAKLYAEETAGDNLDLVIQFGDDNSNGLSIRNKSNIQTSYISASGVITTSTFKGNLDWSYITNKPSSYTPSAHTHAWNSLTHSSTTANQAILTNGSANGWKLYTLNISAWDNAANKAHSHSNKSVLDGITSTHVSNWNTAYNFVSNITKADTDKVINKWDEIVNFLAGIDSSNKLNTLLNSKLSVYELADKTNVGTIKNNGIYYSTTDASSGTLTNSPFNTGFALINMTSYDGGDDLRRSRLAFNAYGEIKVSDDRDQANIAETWYNVLTSKNSGISGSTIKLNGSSITVYSSGTADGRYVKKAGDTMSGVLTIDTTNFGALTIKRNDDANGASIQFRGKSSVYGYIGLNNSTKDKQFLRWNSDTSRSYIILDTSSTYTSSGKGFINGSEITQVSNADTTDGVHLEWAGELGANDYSWLAGWTNDGKKIKAVNKNQFATSGHTHDGRYVRAFGTSNDNIDSDWGQSFKTFDPIPSGTPPEQNPNISLLSIGENFNRRKQLAFTYSNDNIYYRRRVNGSFSNWRRLAFANEIPGSLKNPHALTISLNGTSQGPYDGSATKSINITPGSIGAATSGHNHDGRYVYNYGGTQMDGASRNKNALGMSTTSGISGDWWHILQAAWNDEYRWNSQIAFPTQNRNGMYYRSGLGDNTKWGAWVKLLDTGNSYVTNGKGVINGTTITQVDNATNATNSTNARKLVNWYSARPTSLNALFGDGSLRIFYATSSTTEGKSPNDATVLHLAWDNNSGWDSQLAINSPSGRVYTRSQDRGTWQPWKTLAFTTDIPSSLKNPNAIKFKDINGNVVTYDGSAAKDLTSGIYMAKLPYGFASFASGVSWGNTTGTSFASWNDSTGGSIDFRRDNPSSGKMSIKVDGRVYVNEGRNPVLSAESNSGFWGMRTPDGGNEWIRTPDSGLIPYVPGGAGGGHSSLGTSGWYFSTAYIDKVYGSLKGNADTASSANKLTTARNIALGTDLRGSANFDGSGNITINANINACSVSIGSTNGLPFKRIAHFETGSSWNDNALLLYISQGYINGSNGICRVEFRTDNISTSNSNPSASALVRWLVRNGYGLDSLYAGYYVTAGKAYIDIYLKTTGGYQGTVIRVLQDSRGGINSNVQLINSYYHSDTNHKEAYSSIEAASTALYNRAYTKIVSGSDVGIVSYSNSTGSVHWNNVTNKPSSFTPSSHTHTWASITDKLVAGNEFNIVNAGFNEGVWFNYLPINDRNKTATVQGYHFGNGAKGYTNIKAAGFIKNGSNSSYVLLGDGGHKTISSLSVNYANSAGSATKVIVNQHTGNDTNYPLVWSNQANTSNVTENQLFKSWADLYYNPKNKRLTVGGSVVSSSFVKSGGTSQQLLRADGGVAAFNWSGQSGQPTWLWGGNDFNSYYVYNPSNFRVAYAASAGNADTLDGEHASNFVRAGAIEAGDGDLNALDTYSFIKSVNSKVASHSPKSATGWYNIIQAVHRNGQADGASYIGQIALGMTTNTDDMFFRGKRTDSWKTVIHSGNIGSQTVASASKLVTARKIWGQSFNGTADVNGTIYINNGDSENGAIILNNNVNTHARISAIKDNVVFNTGGAIRFGDLDWDYSKWAGLKYNYLTKTIYLGIADGSIFTTYGNVQNEGTLNLRANISHIDLNSGTSIRGLGTDGSPYYSSITLKNTSMSLSAYGDMTMSTGPGTMQLSAGNAFRVTANDIRLTCGEGSMTCSQTGSNRYTWMFNKALNVGGTLSINGSVIDCSASNISIKSKESGSLMIGTQEIVKYDSHAITFREKTRFLDVLCLSTIPFGSSSPNVATTISTAVCIDVMNYDSQFIFKPATDGQLLFLKVVKRYSSNHIKCTAEDCEVVGAAGFDIYLNRGDTKDIFADGKSRIFIYVSRDKRWYEFYCS